MPLPAAFFIALVVGLCDKKRTSMLLLMLLDWCLWWVGLVRGWDTCVGEGGRGLFEKGKGVVKLFRALWGRGRRGGLGRARKARGNAWGGPLEARVACRVALGGRHGRQRWRMVRRATKSTLHDDAVVVGLFSRPCTSLGRRWTFVGRWCC